MIKKYSTGPLENQANNRSRTVFTKILNNSNCAITARVLVFKLNGKKVLLQSVKLTIPAKSSEFVVTSLKTSVFQFEVQIAVKGEHVLIGVFGKTASGNLNPSHRVVHQELTRIC